MYYEFDDPLPLKSDPPIGILRNFKHGVGGGGGGLIRI